MIFLRYAYHVIGEPS